MNLVQKAALAALMALAVGGPVIGATTAGDTEPAGLISYLVPGAAERLSQYRSVFVDRPNVRLSAASGYQGAKPDDLAAVADLMRETMTSQLEADGYRVVNEPGPGVLTVRLALSDLALRKKKRGLFAYTPVGAIIKAGTDATKDMMDKYDITSMTLEAELADSESQELLAQVVALRGGGERTARLDFDQLQLSIGALEALCFERT